MVNEIGYITVRCDCEISKETCVLDSESNLLSTSCVFFKLRHVCLINNSIFCTYEMLFCRHKMNDFF